MIALKEGTYRLSATVENPEPDRRHRYKWKLWEKGLALVVSAAPIASPAGLGLPTEVLYITKVGSTWLDGVLLNSDAGQLLAAKLEPVVEEPSDWLKREHGINLAPGILDHLVQTGQLTMEQVKAAYEAHLASLEEA